MKTFAVTVAATLTIEIEAESADHARHAIMSSFDPAHPYDPLNGHVFSVVAPGAEWTAKVHVCTVYPDAEISVTEA